MALRRTIGGTRGLSVALALDARIRPSLALPIPIPPLPYQPKNLSTIITERLTARAAETYRRIVARGGQWKVFIGPDWWITMRRFPVTAINRVSKLEATGCPAVGVYTANGLIEQDFVNDVLHTADQS